MLGAVALALAGCTQDHQWRRQFERWPLAVSHVDGEPLLASAPGPITLSVEPSTVMQIGDPVRCIAAAPGQGFLVFSRRTLTHLRRGPDGAWSSADFHPIDREVRSAAPVSDRVAAITGGQPRPTERAPDSGASAEPAPWLLGGEVRLAWVEDDRLVIGRPEEPSGENPYRIRAGVFAGELNLLVFVYNRAPFDQVTRRRPWIYRVIEGEDGRPHLQPRWRGTSFAHPFRDATFGDLTGAGDGEIAALEVDRDGGRLLTAYHFEGFGLEGLAPSVRLPGDGARSQVEDRVEAADWVGDEAQELVVRTTDGAFVFYGLDAAAETLAEVLRVEGPREVLGWIVTDQLGGEPGEIICLLPGGGTWRAKSWDYREQAGAD